MDASPDLDGYMEYRVECAKVYCFAHGPTRKTEAEAIAAWELPAATLAAAVQGEREACAHLVETTDSLVRPHIARLIRSRTSPAVDVLPDALREKAREFIAELDETHEARLTKRLFEMVEELRSLVAASPKAEKKENE